MNDDELIEIALRIHRRLDKKRLPAVMLNILIELNDMGYIRAAQPTLHSDSATPRGERLSDAEYARRLAEQMNETPSR